MKNGKELKIKNSKNLNIKLGSINNKVVKSYYLSISTWCEPKYQDEEVNYSRIVRSLDKKVRQLIYRVLTSQIDRFIPNKTIVDFDLKESGIKFSKRSFINCEITLYTKDDVKINNKDLRKDIDFLIKVISKEIFTENLDFEFYKKCK